MNYILDFFLRLFSPNLTTWQVIHLSNTIHCLHVSNVFYDDSALLLGIDDLTHC